MNLLDECLSRHQSYKLCENRGHTSFLLIFVSSAPYSVCCIQWTFADWANVCTDECTSGNDPVMANSWTFALHYLPRQKASPWNNFCYLKQSFILMTKIPSSGIEVSGKHDMEKSRHWYLDTALRSKPWFPHLIISPNNLYLACRVFIYKMDIPILIF